MTLRGVSIIGTRDTRDEMETNYASVALVQFLFGLFCAYWAQNTGKSPWLWFFLGFFFAPITGIVLLIENRKFLSRQLEGPAS